MKLVSIKARNFLRLEAAEITPDGAVVTINGERVEVAHG